MFLVDQKVMKLIATDVTIAFRWLKTRYHKSALLKNLQNASKTLKRLSNVLKWSQQARRSSGTLWKQRWVEVSCENVHLKKTITLQVTPSAHQDTVAVQAISRGIPIRITCGVKKLCLHNYYQNYTCIIIIKTMLA